MHPIGVDRLGAVADAISDPELLRLENLDTDIRPLEAAVDDDDANSYLPFAGHERLRRAATAHVSRLTGIEYDWRTQCLISAGGLSGFLNVVLALLHPGDEVVLTDPVYVGLLNRVRLAGGTTRTAPLIPAPDGWRLDREGLRAAVGDRTRAIVAMSPSMPTGCVYDADDWAAIAEVCVEHDLWLVEDAAMQRLLFDGKPLIAPATLPGMAERTITVGAASKELRLIGWRVGWTVAPRSVIDAIGLVSISNVVCQVGIAQTAVAVALEEGDADVASATAELQRRRDVLLKEMRGLPVSAPHGGWSVLLDCEALGHDAEGASARLLEHGRIAATPMTGWGDHAGRYVRFVFANEPAARLEGIGDRIRAALG